MRSVTKGMAAFLVVALGVLGADPAVAIAPPEPFRVSPTGFDFGDVAVGDTSGDQSVEIVNVSNSTQTLSLAGGAAGPFGGTTNCAGSLAAGASCQITYRFQPTALGPATRTTTLAVNGENHVFSFTGNGIDAFLVSPTVFDFGDVAVGDTSGDQSVEIVNVSNSTQTLSLAGGAAGPFGGTTNCAGSLAAGASCQITYRFQPTALGPAIRTTTLAVNGENHVFSFTGNGIDAFLVSPTGLDFGPVAIGDSLTLQVDITNVSGSTQTLSLAGGAAGPFGGTTNCAGSLAAGASCQITYNFTPTAPGEVTGSTTLAVNGENHVFSFTGNGYTVGSAPSMFRVSPTGFDFGDVAVGDTSGDQSVEIVNVSNSTQTLSLAGGAAGPFGGTTNCAGSLAAGASCQITYRFQPTALGPATRTTTLAVNGENHVFSFTGNGIDAFLVSPTVFDFGDVAVGDTSGDQSVEIVNVSNSTQTLSLAGGAAGPFGGTTNCAGSLAAGASCQITYRFQPTALGPAIRTTTLAVNGENHVFSFTGNGIDAFLVSPTGLDFGPVAIGDSLTLQVDITNVSGSTQTLSLAGGAAGPFGGTTNCAGSLAAGASCQITYNFTPTAPGEVTGSTTLAVNGENHVFSFTGNGYTTDTTPPTVVANVSGTLGSNGWYVSDVEVSWEVTDAESPIRSSNGCDPTLVDFDTPGTTLTCNATSDGGTTTVHTHVMRDATDPLVTVTGVADGATYVLGLVPTPGCDTSDTMSGVAVAASLTLSGQAPDGSGVVTATCDGALDVAGNGGAARATYNVLTPAEAVGGLLDQIHELDDAGVLKAGQANGLTRPLDAALRSLGKGQIGPACSQLQDFIDEATLKTPDPIDPATAAELIASAEEIRAALSCG